MKTQILSFINFIVCLFFQPNIRFTDTSYIIAQQWEKGREKCAFPNIYAYIYNKKKFDNLAKCDEKEKKSFLSLLQPKSPAKLIRIVPPTVPEKKPKSELTNIKDNKVVALPSVAIEGDRRQRRRRTRSLEKLRDQSREIILSDSDEEIVSSLKLRAPFEYIDEPDASTSTKNGSLPAICIDDSINVCNDAATIDDRSPLPFDDILKIEESYDENTEASDIPNELNACVIVEIHNAPSIELKIHEDGDSNPNIPADLTLHAATFNAAPKKSTKDIFSIAEHSGSYSEDDALALDDDDAHEKPVRLVQSDSEILSKTPLELIVECDINENVIESDLDHNHNDVAKSITTDTSSDSVNTVINDTTKLAKIVDVEIAPVVPVIQQSKRRESISSRSSFDESDGADSEPMYATVDKSLEMVSSAI